MAGDDVRLESPLRERGALLVMGQSPRSKASNSARMWVLTVSTPMTSSSAIWLFEAAREGLARRAGRARSARAAAPRRPSAARAPDVAVRSDSRPVGLRKTNGRAPERIVSPSRSRRRPWTRSPSTKEPLRERPSSTRVHSSPRRSSARVHARDLAVPAQREVVRSRCGRTSAARRREIEDRWAPSPSR